MQNWIIMATNNKGRNMRGCAQIANDDIPSHQAIQLLVDKLERENVGFVAIEAYRIHKDMSRKDLENLDFFPSGCLAEVYVLGQ